jgi:hypothetical protein
MYVSGAHLARCAAAYQGDVLVRMQGLVEVWQMMPFLVSRFSLIQKLLPDVTARRVRSASRAHQ